MKIFFKTFNFNVFDVNARGFSEIYDNFESDYILVITFSVNILVITFSDYI